MSLLYKRKLKYSRPSVVFIPIEASQGFLIGSPINFAAGEFRSVGQKVDEVDLESTETWSLEWEVGE